MNLQDIKTIASIIMIVTFYTIAICFFIMMLIYQKKQDKIMREYWGNEIKNQGEILKTRLKYIEEEHNFIMKNMEENLKVEETKPKRGRKKNVQ